MTYQDYAKQAYRAYGKVTDFKNYQGLPMPKWEELPARIQEAWIAVAKELISAAQDEAAWASLGPL